MKEFRARRQRLLNDAPEWREDPWVSTWVHLHVGRACILVGDIDDAREHLRTAIALATKHRYNEQLIRAEEALELLEATVAGARPAPAAVGQPGAVAVRIAEEVEAACAAAAPVPASA